jgi:hypothetical protein
MEGWKVSWLFDFPFMENEQLENKAAIPFSLFEKWKVGESDVCDALTTL